MQTLFEILEKVKRFIWKCQRRFTYICFFSHFWSFLFLFVCESKLYNRNHNEYQQRALSPWLKKQSQDIQKMIVELLEEQGWKLSKANNDEYTIDEIPDVGITPEICKAILTQSLESEFETKWAPAGMNGKALAQLKDKLMYEIIEKMKKPADETGVALNIDVKNDGGDNAANLNSDRILIDKGKYIYL